MRYLAIARYRYMTAIRTATWLFALAMIAALIILWRTELLFESESHFRAHVDELIPLGARLVVFSYMIHIAIVLGACTVFGLVRRGAQNAGTGDLLETAPILPRHRFLGDAAGIFAAAMMIHLCTLPLLALTVAVSPYPTSFFAYGELLIFILVLFASASASWKLRAESFRWSYTRGARSQATFLTLFVIVLWLNTLSMERFFEAVFRVFAVPSPRALARIAEWVNDPVLFFSSLAVLFGGFLCFFYFHAVRSLQQR